jgi:hypothetical protein
MQIASYLQNNILLSVAIPAVQDFSTWAHKGHDYTKIIIEQKYILISSTNFYENFLILKRIQRYFIINVHRSSSKVPLFLWVFNENRTLLIDFKKYSNTKFHENLSNGSQVVECGRRDRRTDWLMYRGTDMTEASSLLSQYYESAER